MSDRYDSSTMPEGQYQPGSNGQVLLNKMGITDPVEVNDIELELLAQLHERVFSEVLNDQVITTQDICEWHRRWLGNLYEWAGKQRSVNLGKDGFQFASATQIPRLLEVLEKDYLAKYTPCQGFSDEKLAEAIAVVHIEFILIHPFRDGNGRIARLLADVMALQAGKLELDYSFWDANKATYFRAIHSGLMRDYEPMKGFVRQALPGSGLPDE